MVSSTAVSFSFWFLSIYLGKPAQPNLSNRQPSLPYFASPARQRRVPRAVDFSALVACISGFRILFIMIQATFTVALLLGRIAAAAASALLRGGALRGLQQLRTTDILVSDDTFVRDSSVNTNYNENTNLSLSYGAANDERITYVKFPLGFDITNADSIDNAMMYFRVNQAPLQDMTLNVYRCDTEFWVEDMITWNERPGYDTSTVLSSALVTTGDATNWIGFDVTTALRDAKQANQIWMSLVLQIQAPADPPSDRMKFDSKEDGTFIPYMTVSFDPGEGTASPTMSPSTAPSVEYDQPEYPPLVSIGADGSLVYEPYANEINLSHGSTANPAVVNTVPDFSAVGYKGGGVPIPFVPVSQTVFPNPAGGDRRADIQAAIDAVAALPLDANGFRGAVLLKAGVYEVSEPGLTVYDSGIVIRGEGQGETGGTRIIYTSLNKESDAITVGFTNGKHTNVEPGGVAYNVTDSFTPTGSMTINITDTSLLSPGDRILIQLLPNDDWLLHMSNMEQWGWIASGYQVVWPRIITAVDGNQLTLDAPVVHPIESVYGGARVYRYELLYNSVNVEIENVGVENLRIESVFASDTDENHGRHALYVQRVRNGWFRQVTSQYFWQGTILLRRSSYQVTVEDCAALDPKGTLSGGRRYPFALGGSTGTLFQRNYARDFRHSYASGSRTGGPHVFVDSVAITTFNDIGPHERFSTGQLYDNILTNISPEDDGNGGEMNVQNRGPSGSGHGWAGVQIMFWNSEATQWRVHAANGAMSWAVGMKGPLGDRFTREPEPDGIFQSLGTFVTPRSLYHAQLRDRMGPNALHSVILPMQKSGNIWNDLQAWAGNGLFGDPVLAWFDEEIMPIAAGNSLDIGGMVRDLNLLGSSPTYTWTQLSGPGAAVFGDSSLLETDVFFTNDGDYVLSLEVSDGSSGTTEAASLEITIGLPAPSQSPSDTPSVSMFPSLQPSESQFPSLTASVAPSSAASAAPSLTASAGPSLTASTAPSISLVPTSTTSTTGPSPPTGQAFQSNTELADAVTAYLADSSSTSLVAQTYGWPIGTWNVSLVTGFQNLFQGAADFNEDISAWDTSSVTNMRGVFERASSFNQPLDTWDTSLVTNMEALFGRTSAFNQPLNSWDVSKVVTTNGMFFLSSFNMPLDSWDVRSLKDARSMFARDNAFSQDIAMWDVSGLERTNSMFSQTNSFNVPLQSWNLASATEMRSMFAGNTAFNQDLCSWGPRISTTTTVTSMFSSTSLCPQVNVDPVLAASPPGPFCYACTLTSVTSSPSAAPVTSSPSEAPVTSSPSVAPVTSSPSEAPVTSSPSEAPVTSSPSEAPVTSSPSAAPVTSSPSEAPVTSSPSVAPVTSSPSEAPVTSSPSEAPVTNSPSEAPVTSSPSEAPVTSSPSVAPVTSSPSEAPVTSSPSEAPMTSSPSEAPVTSSPSEAPVTNSPSEAPVTSSPSEAPVTSSPSVAPVTSSPSEAPVTSSPSEAPVTSSPSEAPVTSSPSEAPMTSSPSEAPVTSSPSVAPVTSSPSEAPVTSSPSEAPVTNSPSEAPVTISPSEAPVTKRPSEAPVTSSPSVAPVTSSPSAAPVTQEPTHLPMTAPATSEPSPLPTLPPAPVPFCFNPESSTVIVKGKGPLSIMDLQVNDLVLSDHRGSYSKVYAFGHKNNDQPSSFVKVETSASIIELTKDHMIYLAEEDSPIPAGALQVGDKLKLGHPSNITDAAVVQKVTHNVSSIGYVTPITHSGTIVVNGIVASNYAGKSGTGYYYTGRLLSVHYHDVSHLAVAPLRFVCTWISSSYCGAEYHYSEKSQTHSGQHYFLALVHSLKHFVKSQSCGPVLHALFFVLVVGTGLLFSLLEKWLYICMFVVAMSRFHKYRKVSYSKVAMKVKQD